jgi:putative nucleotidyltransferase with HDIG domain
MELSTVPPTVEPLTSDVIDARLRGCPRLPSLGSINIALRELLNADQRYTSHISDVIRRDPSLTARLLRLVNSVYYGITTPVKTIEEAVFYLGVRQIRQLAMVTPVIEDFQRLAGNARFPWREFWQHCIGTALLTSEVINSTQAFPDEADYVAGLVHDVGKIAMAAAFPHHFAEIRRRIEAGEGHLLDIESEVLGISHPELGALYLRSHNLPPMMVEAAHYHHTPDKARCYPQVAAAVQIADLLVRYAKIGASGNPVEVAAEDWLNASGWDLLFAERGESDKAIARANLNGCIERLPSILDGLV